MFIWEVCTKVQILAVRTKSKYRHFAILIRIKNNNQTFGSTILIWRSLLFLGDGSSLF